MKDILERLRSDLSDPEYRHAYAQDFLDSSLAHQIRALRNHRGWTQAELAAKVGTQQPFISAIENEDYGVLSISKLKELSEAFDVYLSVRFESFSRLLSDVARSSTKDLEVPEFSADPYFKNTVLTISTLDSVDLWGAGAPLNLFVGESSDLWLGGNSPSSSTIVTGANQEAPVIPTDFRRLAA